LRDESFTRLYVAVIVIGEPVRLDIRSGDTVGHQHNTSSGRSTLLKAMGVVTVCGLDIAVLILLGVLAGAFVDDRLHSSPWGLLAGLFVGLGCGLYTAYRIIAPLVRAL